MASASPSRDRGEHLAPRPRPRLAPTIVRVRRGETSRLVEARRLFDRPPDPTAARAYLAEPSNVFLLAYDGTAPVGFLRGTALLQVDTRRRQMFLYEVGVEARYRHRGVGRALVEALLSLARRRGFEEVFVFTSPSNRAAVGLYLATGARTETTADRMYVYRLRRGRTAGSRHPPRVRAARFSVRARHSPTFE